MEIGWQSAGIKCILSSAPKRPGPAGREAFCGVGFLNRGQAGLICRLLKPLRNTDSKDRWLNFQGNC